jgi:glycosyltransferase involved in cell wall biosynthesis
MPRFSAIIASYNQAERVLEAVASVKRQTLSAHEIIVVDDGSTDGTAEILQKRFPEVKVVVQENNGKGLARNHGAFLATGDWLCFLDHDDLWHPEKLAAIDEYLGVNPEVVALDHHAWIFREDDSGPRTAWGLKVDFAARTLDEALAQAQAIKVPSNDFTYLHRMGNTYEASLRRIFSTTSAMSVRRDVFFKVGGFSPTQVNGEDWTLATNVGRLGEWHTLRRPLSFQRFLPDSDTADAAGMTMIMTTLVSHWYSGRPLTRRTRGFEFIADLRRLGPTYRELAQTAIWDAARRRDARGVASAIWLSLLVLPDARDRLYAFAPPPLTTRLTRTSSLRRMLSRSPERCGPVE